MKITEISYRRVFNLGNYETVTVELVSTVDEGEMVEWVWGQLESLALERFFDSHPAAKVLNRSADFPQSRRSAL